MVFGYRMIRKLNEVLSCGRCRRHCGQVVTRQNWDANTFQIRPTCYVKLKHIALDTHMDISPCFRPICISGKGYIHKVHFSQGLV